MSWLYYEDCDAVSPNGKFLLEARSPHNGAINHRDGNPAIKDEFEVKYGIVEPRDFRYRLIDNTTRPSPNDRDRFVIWERWQQGDEGSPTELVVSDEGWSVVRSNSYAPEIMTFSPVGQVTRVMIRGPEARDEPQPFGLSARKPGLPIWRAEHIQFTSAGVFWSINSWRYFFRANGVNYFAWRTSCGQRLVIELDKALILDDAEQAALAINASMRETEVAGASALLSELVANADKIKPLKDRWHRNPDFKHPVLETFKHADAAIHLVGVHRVRNCIALLRQLEPFDIGNGSTQSIAMGYSWHVVSQYCRPMIHHSLRLLGQVPLGYATYHFEDDRKRFPAPELVRDRRELAQNLTLGMNALQVLRLLGSPDHVERTPRGKGDQCRWEETWDYDSLVDGNWLTLRILWEEAARRSRMVSFEEEPSYWLTSNEREAELLRF